MDFSFNDIDKDSAEELLRKASYKVAKTMPNSPHSYSLIHGWENKKDFYSLVMYIRKHGYVYKFWNKEYIYYDFEGHHYWTMGFPLDQTILINKAPIK
jgi:hypothetical protein